MYKKSFIAGALCPQCQSRDTIVVIQEPDKKIMACVECDFQQPHAMNISSQSTTEQPIVLLQPID